MPDSELIGGPTREQLVHFAVENKIPLAIGLKKLFVQLEPSQGDNYTRKITDALWNSWVRDDQLNPDLLRKEILIRWKTTGDSEPEKKVLYGTLFQNFSISKPRRTNIESVSQLPVNPNEPPEEPPTNTESSPRKRRIPKWVRNGVLALGLASSTIFAKEAYDTVANIQEYGVKHELQRRVAQFAQLYPDETTRNLIYTVLDIYKDNWEGNNLITVDFGSFAQVLFTANESSRIEAAEALLGEIDKDQGRVSAVRRYYDATLKLEPKVVIPETDYASINQEQLRQLVPGRSEEFYSSYSSYGNLYLNFAGTLEHNESLANSWTLFFDFLQTQDIEPSLYKDIFLQVPIENIFNPNEEFSNFLGELQDTHQKFAGIYASNNIENADSLLSSLELIKFSQDFSEYDDEDIEMLMTTAINTNIPGMTLGEKISIFHQNMGLVSIQTQNSSNQEKISYFYDQISNISKTFNINSLGEIRLVLDILFDRTNNPVLIKSYLYEYISNSEVSIATIQSLVDAYKDSYDLLSGYSLEEERFGPTSPEQLNLVFKLMRNYEDVLSQLPSEAIDPIIYSPGYYTTFDELLQNYEEIFKALRDFETIYGRLPTYEEIMRVDFTNYVFGLTVIHDYEEIREILPILETKNLDEPIVVSLDQTQIYLIRGNNLIESQLQIPSIYNNPDDLFITYSSNNNAWFEAQGFKHLSDEEFLIRMKNTDFFTVNKQGEMELVKFDTLVSDYNIKSLSDLQKVIKDNFQFATRILPMLNGGQLDSDSQSVQFVKANPSFFLVLASEDTSSQEISNLYAVYFDSDNPITQERIEQLEQQIGKQVIQITLSDPNARSTFQSLDQQYSFGGSYLASGDYSSLAFSLGQ